MKTFVIDFTSYRSSNHTVVVVPIDFPNIRLSLSDLISELRSIDKVSSEMNVSRRVGYRSVQDFYLLSSEQIVTVVQR